MKSILVTGAAGFIGSSLVERLLEKSFYVIGIDNFHDYYSKETKIRNLKLSKLSENFLFKELDIFKLSTLPKELKIDVIIHLAAYAGVRNSIDNPNSYYKNNVEGTLEVLNFAKDRKIEKIIFGSSSSVYGENSEVPWNETSKLMPISPYASSKISCENLGRVYSSLYNINFTSLRFFTVYGPRQRPDLAIHKFTNKILSNQEIEIYGDGDSFRDYTYIDDITIGIINSIYLRTSSKFEILNLGNNNTVSLLEMIETIEKVVQKKAIKKFIENQKGDAHKTYADISKAQDLLDYNPSFKFYDGIRKFYNWYLNDK